jgi:uncharacterized membrane protein YiaA
MQNQNQFRPSNAFVGASWGSLFLGIGGYLIGLWNSAMPTDGKGYYFAILVLGLFAAISMQKTIRDKMDGLPVTGIYMGTCWIALGTSVLLLTFVLYNASFELAVKGFYGMAYLMSLFAVITVQKNVRDLASFRDTKADKLDFGTDIRKDDPL